MEKKADAWNIALLFPIMAGAAACDGSKVLRTDGALKVEV